MNILELIQVHELGYRLKDVKANFEHDVRIIAPEVSIEAKNGEMQTIPRWVADVLYDEKIADIKDDDMASELKQTISKENNQGQFSMATLPEDFYIKMNNYLKRLPMENRSKLQSILNELVRTRQSKIIQLTDSSNLTADLAKKLSLEERSLFEYFHSKNSEFKKQIMREDK